jgi:hypothetical protein
MSQGRMRACPCRNPDDRVFLLEQTFTPPSLSFKPQKDLRPSTWIRRRFKSNGLLDLGRFDP